MTYTRLICIVYILDYVVLFSSFYSHKFVSMRGLFRLLSLIDNIINQFLLDSCWGRKYTKRYFHLCMVFLSNVYS